MLRVCSLNNYINDVTGFTPTAPPTTKIKRENNIKHTSITYSTTIMGKKRQVPGETLVTQQLTKQKKSKTFKFDDGANQFRLRLICALLTLKPITIRNIRSDDIEDPGLRDYEVAFLKLLDQITDGSSVEINSTGTLVRFKPGLLLGGEHSFDGCCDKNVGWFMEGILPVAPFGKEALTLRLHGVTDGQCSMDPSVDYIQAALVPLMQRFGVGTDGESPPPQAKVIRRGQAPLGQGEAMLYCPIVKELNAIDFTDPGKFRRVRGTAIACRISPSSPARVAHAAKGVLHNLIPDVWIHTETHSGSKKREACGPSPGLGVWMAIHSTTDAVLCAEVCHDPKKERGVELPEDLGQRGAFQLLEEVKRGGCIDSSAQIFCFLLMSGAGPEDVSRIRIGTLTKSSIASLRLLKQAFDIEFKVTADPDSKTVLLNCLGAGYRNMARASAA